MWPFQDKTVAFAFKKNDEKINKVHVVEAFYLADHLDTASDWQTVLSLENYDSNPYNYMLEEPPALEKCCLKEILVQGK